MDSDRVGSASVPRARLGVVLTLPAAVAAEIDGLRRALGDGALGRVEPHLTIVPPVNVAERRIPEALALVRDAAASTATLALDLGPATTFWPATPVVYLAVEGDVGPIHGLHAALDVDPLVRPTTWPFIPHVTVGDEVDPAVISAAVSAMAHYRRTVVVTSIAVLREEPDRTWARIADAELSGRRVVGRGGVEIVLDRGEHHDGERRGTPFAVEARVEGSRAGVAAGRSDDDLWVTDLQVDPARRGQGIGRQLLREVEAIGRERDCARVLLLCPADLAGRAWLEGRGWRVDLALPAWRGTQPWVRLCRRLV
jgi:GNAT superfamily N-acetyltransferase